MAAYELTIVLDGKATPAKRKAVMASVDKILSILKGKVGKVEEWGVKDLAYKINNLETGYFVFYPLELEPDQVKALNLKLKMEEEVIRHLLVKRN